MTNRVKDKVALITGAARGIGKATAQLFADENAQVIIADINEIEGRQVAKDLTVRGQDAIFIHLDVTCEQSWKNAMVDIEKVHPHLDILVNNAAIGIGGSIVDSTFENWRNVIAHNLDSIFLGTKYAVQLMQKSKKGSIVNVSSAYGLIGNPGSSAYCASKGGVRLFTKAAALEFAEFPYPIRVNSICPGAVKTPMWEQGEGWADFVESSGGIEGAWQKIAEKKSVLPRCADAIEIAQGILYLASDESSYMTGTDLVIDGGASAR